MNTWPTSEEVSGECFPNSDSVFGIDITRTLYDWEMFRVRDFSINETMASITVGPLSPFVITT